MAPPHDDERAAPGAEDTPAEGQGTLDAAAARVDGLRRALTIQEDDSPLVGALKILGMIVTAVLLLALSPLILLGLVVGLAAAA